MLARLRPYVLLFWGLNVVYHANLRPVDSGDALPGSLVPFAILLDHSITLDRFVPWLRGHVWYTHNVIREAHGHSFSSFPIGGPMLVTPLYLPGALVGLKHWDAASLVMLARIAQKFAASAVTALSAVWFLLLLQRITTERWAWCLTLVYALATETWSISSQALWQQGPSELALVGCFYGLERWAEDRSRGAWLWVCGACAAAAFVIRPTNLVLGPAVLAAFLLARAPVMHWVRFLMLPVAGCALVAGYNLYVFHRLSGGYAASVLAGSIAAGLTGLILSPARGLLIFTPVLIFALLAFLPAAAEARRRHNSLLVTAVGFVILEALVVSRSVMWWGGYSWGPRLLTELIPPLILLMAIGVHAIGIWPRRLFALLAVYSMLIQALGAFFYPKGHWDGTPQSVDAAPARLWDWADNPIARTLRGGLYWEPYSIVAAGFTGGIAAARERIREVNVNAYEEAQPAKVPRAGPGLP